MKSPKGLLDYKGKPWLTEQLSQIKESGSPNCVVILGEKKDEYFKKIPFLKEGKGQWDELKITCVVNDHPERGPFSSVNLALQSLVQETAKWPGIFILPVDVPLTQTKNLIFLVEALKGPVKACVPTFEGLGGHPVLLSRSFVMSLLALSIDDLEARLDVQLRLLHETQIKRVDVDDRRAFTNLNTPDDWQRFLKNN